jgi:gliding motility-associated-like protein
VIQAARDGCAAYDTVTVKVLQEANIYFPNAFSPNGDGANDVYTIFIGNDSIRVESFKVFSRWDGLVYLKDNPDIINGQVPTWDGLDGRDKVPDRKRAYNPGVFVYVAEVRMPDNSLLTFKGDIHLVR